MRNLSRALDAAVREENARAVDESPIVFPSPEEQLRNTEALIVRIGSNGSAVPGSFQRVILMSAIRSYNERKRSGVSAC